MRIYLLCLAAALTDRGRKICDAAAIACAENAS